MLVKRKTTKRQLELARKRMTKADTENMQRSAQELCQKRDELLQEILEIRIQLASENADKDELEEKMKRCVTGVVLCEKMIGSFGKF